MLVVANRHLLAATVLNSIHGLHIKAAVLRRGEGANGD